MTCSTTVTAASRHTCPDVRALLLDPVDLRGTPQRDSDGRTRRAPPVFLPPGDAKGRRRLVNLEEPPSAIPGLDKVQLVVRIWIFQPSEVPGAGNDSMRRAARR